MFSLLWSLLIGGVIGWLAGMIIGRDVPGGVFGNIVAGVVGGWLGHALLGTWGPEIANFAVIPALIGSIALVFLASLLMRGMRKTAD